MMARIGWAALCVTISAIIAFLAVYQTHKKRDATALSTIKVMVGEGHGSGVHVGNGYIITAAHVAGDAKSVKVKNSLGSVGHADVLWVNKAHDIALLRISVLALEKGDEGAWGVSRLHCEDPKIGQSVIAIGNPGPLEFITAHGNVASGPKHSDEHWRDHYIVSMPIAPGMSGGPVLDHHGRVVGIVVGVAMMSVGWSGAPVGFGYIAPASAICKLLARNA
jgi:S1-C subfamily serine protease